MVTYLVSAVLSTRDWWNVHVNSRVSYLPSFLGKKNPRNTNCEEVYAQFYLLRQCFYVRAIEKGPMSVGTTYQQIFDFHCVYSLVVQSI